MCTLSESSNQLLFDEMEFAAQEIFEMIERGENVGLNCYNGRTRSPVAVAAFLIAKLKLKLEQVKAGLDKAMCEYHGDVPKWNVFDRESRFTLHLKAY